MTNGSNSLERRKKVVLDSIGVQFLISHISAYPDCIVPISHISRLHTPVSHMLDLEYLTCIRLVRTDFYSFEYVNVSLIFFILKKIKKTVPKCLLKMVSALMGYLSQHKQVLPLVQR